MTNPGSKLISRNITLLTEVRLVKPMVFPVGMYGCEIWTIKKLSTLNIDTFELWCCRRLLRVPCTANQSILKEISPQYLLEGLMLKLKLQYFDHLMQRTDSLEMTLKLGKIKGRSRRGLQRMRWLDGITDLMDTSWASSGSWWWTGKPDMPQSWGCKESDMTELNTWEGFETSSTVHYCTSSHVLRFQRGFFINILSICYLSMHQHIVKISKNLALFLSHKL